MQLVEVRPLPTNKWHGKKNKESFARPKALEVLLDPMTGGYATGLSPEEEVEYSAKMGVSLDNRFIPGQPHIYWSTKAATIYLKNETMTFNPQIPSDYVKIKNMKASSKVANSLKEWEEGMWPDATHVIYDEAEEVGRKASKVEAIERATLLSAKMSLEDKANMVQLLSKRTVKGRSADFINVEVHSLIHADAEEFMRIAKMGKEEIAIRAALYEGLFKNILTKEGVAIYYMGEQIGADFEDALKYFKHPDNQKIKVAILEKLNATK